MRSIGRVEPELAMRVIVQETVQFFAEHLSIAHFGSLVQDHDRSIIDLEKPAHGDLRAKL
jgi:hypothetical protein